MSIVGRKPKMTLAKLAILREWGSARRALGSRKVIARRLGVSISTVDTVIAQMHGCKPHYKRQLEQI